MNIQISVAALNQELRLLNYFHQGYLCDLLQYNIAKVKIFPIDTLYNWGNQNILNNHKKPVLSD